MDTGMTRKRTCDTRIPQVGHK